jgi:hypothetical protein
MINSAAKTTQPVDGWGLLLGLSVIGFFIALIVVGASYYYRGVADHCKATPTPISCATLADNGPPADNWHVLVSDYTFDKATMLSKNGSFEKLVCTVVPIDAANHSTNVIKLSNGNLSNDQEAYAFLKQKTVEAIAFPANNHEVKLEVRQVPTAADFDNKIKWGVIAAGITAVLIIFAGYMRKK